jgi:hypothetical protein
LRISYETEQVERIEHPNLSKSNPGSAVRNKIYRLSQRIAIILRNHDQKQRAGAHTSY